MPDFFDAPTPSNTPNAVASTASASAQQNLPDGKNIVTLTGTQAFYILFGQTLTASTGVTTPTASNSLMIPANTVVRIRTQRGASSFKVLRVAADGVVSYTYAAWGV